MNLISLFCSKVFAVNNSPNKAFRGPVLALLLPILIRVLLLEVGRIYLQDSRMLHVPTFEVDSDGQHVPY
jgi:hypothetical protein